MGVYLCLLALEYISCLLGTVGRLCQPHFQSMSIEHAKLAHTLNLKGLISWQAQHGATFCEPQRAICAVMCALSNVCSHTCALICVLSCVCVCVLIPVLSHVCYFVYAFLCALSCLRSHMIALVCVCVCSHRARISVLLDVSSHVRALTFVLFYVCSHVCVCVGGCSPVFNMCALSHLCSHMCALAGRCSHLCALITCDLVCVCVCVTLGITGILSDCFALCSL